MLKCIAAASLLVASVDAKGACKVGPYDLGREQTETATSPYTWTDANGDFLYSVTICGTNACGDGTASVCQQSLNYPPVTALGSWDDGATWTETGDGVTTEFSNGAMCNGSPRVATMNLHCATTNQLNGISEPQACHYTVDVNVICTGGAYGGGGLSGGWAFIIALVVAGVLYIGLGCLYTRKKMGTTGMKESIPNVDFWSDFPFLVKDGCSFFVGKVKDKCGKGSIDGTSYDEI